MSESEDDAPASEPAGDGAQYAYEGLWESAAEKNRVMSLPEIQRENFIADRREEVHRRKQDAEIQKLAALTKAESEKQDSRAAKRKAGGDVEDGQRKSRKVQQSERLDSYKRQREQRHQQRTRDSDRRNRDRSSDSSRHSDADAEGESDVEYDQPRAAPARGDPPCTLDDLRKAKVGRTNFAMVCHYPKFEEAITGCWARVCIGPNRETGQSIYRMAEVKGTLLRPVRQDYSNASQGSRRASHTKSRRMMASLCGQSSMQFLPMESWRRRGRSQLVRNLQSPMLSSIATRAPAPPMVCAFPLNPTSMRR